MAYGLLPTDSRIQELDDFTLEYLHAVILKEEEGKYERMAQFLGMKWDRADVVSLISSRSGNVTPESMTLPLALAVNPQLVDVLKNSFGLKGKEGYSPDAHTDSLIAGKVVKPGEGVEIVEIDERFTKDQAKDFFERTDSSAVPVPEDARPDFDPARLRNEPDGIISNEIPEGLQQLLDERLRRG